MITSFKYFARLVGFAALVVTVSASASETAATKIIRSDYKKGEIAQLCDQAIAGLQNNLTNKTKSAYDFEKHLADFSDLVTPYTFMAYVSTVSDQRDEGSACEEKYGQLMVEVFTRRDLYEIVSKTKTRTAAQKKLVLEIKRSFERNGMALPDDQLQRFKTVKSELATLESQFSKNLNEDVTSITVSPEELEGVPQDFISRLKKSGNQVIVTTKSTDYTVVIDNAKNPATRQKILQAYESRAGAANIPLLERAVVLRQELAKIMGYATWADYRTDGRMAKTAATAFNLLDDLRVKLNPRVQNDLDILLAAKKQMEDPAATTISPWDVRYFANQVKKRDYSLDDEVIREYFPKDLVMAGLFEVYQKILGVKFEEVKGADVWSPDVKLYSIRRPFTKSIIGYFYADFVPREGKYGHAAAFTLIQGRKLGLKYSKPVSSIVANFAPPANGKPSLLSHDEVETLFHEFGHIMHQTLTRAPFATLAGTSVAQDFVEAPSQMLENWVWNKDILKIISGHYTDNSKKLSDELIAKMLAAKDFNLGYFYTRQIILGLTDLKMHMAAGPVDVNGTYRQMHKDLLGYEPVQGSTFMAGFGHMMGGYDAGYYGYIWSEVYAADMFTAFEKNGLLDQKTGKAYRRSILEKGSLQDPLDLVTEFLGRAPTNDAFLKKLGL